MQNIPQHIAIIPDGNRRWAKKRGLLSFFGHRKGVETTEEIFKIAIDLGIPYLTFWGCSIANIEKRSKKEVLVLFDIFQKQFKKLADSEDIHKNQVKINILGRWQEMFPKNAKIAMQKAIDNTKNYNNHQLTFLMAYSGTDEMTNAIQEIAKIKNKNEKIKIDEKIIKQNLWTKDLPPIDLVIRTGGEPNWSHWSSGFMMWDSANAQFYFSQSLYPDFSAEEFKRAISKYNQAERKLGK